VARFVDTYISNKIRGWPCEVIPRFSTIITASDSGAEQANRRWRHPLYSYQLPEAIRSHADYEAIRDHWLAMGGPAQTWPWKDPLDFASRALIAPNRSSDVDGADQLLGTGDGVQAQYQLIKTYTVGAQSYVREITLPVVDSVVVLVDGDAPEDLIIPLTWTVSRPGGVIQFDGPVPLGMPVTAGYLFDVEVRFEADDSFEGIAKAYSAAGVSDLKLIGVRSC
jgi:uncharacterized protein (TIGR02217 family)